MTTSNNRNNYENRISFAGKRTRQGIVFEITVASFGLLFLFFSREGIISSARRINALSNTGIELSAVKFLRSNNMLHDSLMMTSLEENLKANSMNATSSHGVEIKQRPKPFAKPLTPFVEDASIATTSEFVGASLKKSLYFCGYPLTMLAQEIFPDYHFKGKLLKDSKPTRNDILFFGTFGPCYYDVAKFPGKAIFLNGEVDKDVISASHQYRLGPEPDNGVNSMRLYYIAAILINYYEPPMWLRIAQPSLRPQSSLEYKAVLYTSSRCLEHRQQAALEISNVIPLFFGGKCMIPSMLSNGTGTVYEDTRFVGHRDSYISNVGTNSKFQFCLVMENTKQEGYITEKLLLAYLGGCLPIYWGTTDVFELFYPQSFVYYDVDNPQPALRLLAYLYHKTKRPTRSECTVPYYVMVTKLLKSTSPLLMIWVAEL